MNEKLELIELSKTIPEGYIYITNSKRIGGYQYVTKHQNFDMLSQMFGEPGESDLAFADDSTEWLNTLFDEESFEAFEDSIIKHFGSEQKTVDFMSVGSSLKHYLDESQIIVTQKEINTKYLTENREEVDSVLTYFKEIDTFETRRCFLAVLSAQALSDETSKILTNKMYDEMIRVIESFSRDNFEESAQYLHQFMKVFRELIEEEKE